MATNRTYLDLTGLTQLISLVKGGLTSLDSNKVDKVDGYSLTKNDLTDDLKAKYDAAQANVLEKVSVNGTALEISEKGVDVTVPTKVSDLTNDSDFASKTEVGQMIADIDHLKRVIVNELPTQDIDISTIYMVKAGEDDGAVTGNVYSEYLYIDDTWELIGSSAVDLSQYYTKTEIDTKLADYTKTVDQDTFAAITDAEITNLFNN